MTYLSCPECGCTDVHVTAWIHANTGEVQPDEAPAEYAYCPQCAHDGYDGSMRDRDLVQTETLKPFAADIAAQPTTHNPT